MSDDARINELLDRWKAGDRGAAGEAILACEPYVLMVVRRRLSERARAKFDSMDIVQSVWADVLADATHAELDFPDADRLRGYLGKVANHLLIDRLRHHRAAFDAEKPLGIGATPDPAGSREPKPSEVVQADDLWERMRSLCPPAHRDLLEMKRQGLPLAAIAERSGLHEGSVRRILYDLARRMNHG